MGIGHPQKKFQRGTSFCEFLFQLNPKGLEVWGLSAKPQVAGGKGVWGQIPQCLEILQIFHKNNAF